MTDRFISRRRLLAAAPLLLRPGVQPARAATDKLRGIFPIVQTPYTASGAVDFAALEQEVRFLDRCGVHGIVWPQRASQYQYLSFSERIEGVERIAAANQGRKPALVIGVQASDTATAVRYARHAATLRPDAIIALPTKDRGEFNLDEVAKYFAAIAKACDLPLFIQTTGNMSVEFMTKLEREMPILQFVKDEAGDPVRRLSEFRARGSRLRVFTGNHGRTLIEEMIRGVAGNMPASAWADLYVQVWDHWHAGRHNQALDAFSKAQLFIAQATQYGFPAIHYVLRLRGVFPNADIRGSDFPPLDDDARKSLRATYEFVKPHLTVR
ncbi:MAG: dihydrodipicolinate synthase family protein [Acidobacteriia bacterium]|nr:dihydrodipicolinate synthase family protein [Terriglobia bacterium]